MKKIVILGAGFAGLRTALDLAKQKNKIRDHEIILIDKRDVHIYTPDLYEIATATTPNLSEVCLEKLADTVALPLKKILANKPITFLSDHVDAWDPIKKSVKLESGKSIIYDHLVVAMGSVTNDYGIPGLAQFSYPLKTVKQALVIHNHLDQYFHYLWSKKIKKEVNIVIGGGGATGVEFAGELPEAVRTICKKYRYPFSKVHMTLVQGSGELIGVGAAFSRKVEARLKSVGIRIALNTMIVKAAAGKLTVKDKKGTRAIPADMVVWAGGVKPHPFLLRQSLPCEKNGAVRVDQNLQSTDFNNVFVAGDMASFFDEKTGKRAPWLAQVAVVQGGVVAKNLIASIHGTALVPYRIYIKGVIIPVAGRYAVFKSGGGKIILGGRLFWVLRRLIDLYYATTILPLPYALRKWWNATTIFVQNDPH